MSCQLCQKPALGLPLQDSSSQASKEREGVIPDEQLWRYLTKGKGKEPARWARRGSLLLQLVLMYTSW